MFTVTKSSYDFTKKKYGQTAKVADEIATYEEALEVALAARVMQDMPPIIIIYDSEKNEHTEVPLFGKVLRSRVFSLAHKI